MGWLLVSVSAKDFFVSYTGADQVWAEWIADQLEAAGYTTVLQAWDFRPGENFVLRMNQALEEAARVLAVLSPRYFTGSYATDEWTAALVRAAGETDRLLLVRIEACELPPVIANRIYIDLTGLDEPAAIVRLRAGVAQGRAKPTSPVSFPGHATSSARSRFPSQRPVIFAVPARNRNFTGRRKLLKALRHTLRTRRAGAVVQAGALYGLGGVGKTQLAVEYAHRHAADYDLIWWMAAGQPLAIPGQLAALARRLGLPELANQDEQRQLLWDRLMLQNRWLLVYDNATTPRDLAVYRPPAGHGQLLITSRNPAWGAMAAPVPVDVLPREEAVAFLNARLGRDDPALGELAAALGDLPLALEQAAAYLEQTTSSITDYLTLLQERAAELLTLGELADYPQTVATTWTLSLAQVQMQAPVAEELLALCGFLANEVPRPLLADHAAELPEPLRSAAADRLVYDRVLAALNRYSLVTVTKDALTLHLLVQTVVREGLDQPSRERWAGVAVRLLHTAFPDDSDDVNTWPVCALLLPHAIAALNHAQDLGADPAACVSLLSQAGGYLWRRAELAQARQLFERALAIEEARLDPNHLQVAERLSSLGGVLTELRDLPAARTHLERALAIREAQLDPEHPDVAKSLNNLGNALCALGDYTNARDRLERALAIFRTRLNPNHPLVAVTLSNLGVALTGLGDLAAARDHLQHALAIDETRFGPNHPDVANSLNNLGNVLGELGDLTDARAHLERALAIRQTRLGPEHLGVAESLKNLGIVLERFEELGAARDHYRRALAIYEARLGPGHSDTAKARVCLAGIVDVLGEHPGNLADEDDN